MAPKPVIHRIATVGQQTGIGVCHSRVGVLSAILKPDIGYVIANEQIASAIGQFLKLPVPAFGLAHPGVRGMPIFFASVSFNFGADDLPPCDVVALGAASPSQCAGILMFDSLIGNLDRHCGNLAFYAPRSEVYVFDHSHAVLGETPGQGPARMTKLLDDACLNFEKKTDERYVRHCLIDTIVDGSYFVPWYEKIRSIPDWWLRETVQSAHKLTPTEQAAAVDFLRHRRDNLAAIIGAHLHLFPHLIQSPIPS